MLPESEPTSSVDHAFGRASIGRNLLALLSSQAVTWILGTAVAIIQPRFIGPEGQGSIRLAVALWTIPLVIGSLGTSMYLVLEIARDRDRGLTLVGPVIVLRTIAFTLTSLALVAYVVIAQPNREFIIVMSFVGVSSLLALIAEGVASAMVGLERMAPRAIADVISRLVGTIGVIVVVVLSGDIRHVVTVMAASNAVNLVLLVRAFRLAGPIAFRGWRRHGRRIIHGSLGFLASAAILTVYQQVDTVVIATLVDKRALGWYATGDALFASSLFVPTIVVSALFPVMGRLYSTDRVELVRLVERTFPLLFAIAIPIGFVTSALGPQLATILYGEEFSETGQVLVALGPVITMTYATTFIGAYGLATERRTFFNRLMIVATIATIPLDLILVPWTDKRFDNGAIGGALAYVVTEGFVLTVALVFIAPQLLRPPANLRLARTVLAGAGMFAAIWPLRDTFILIPIAVGAVVYLAGIAVLRVLGAQDLAMLVRIVRRDPELPIDA